LTERSAVVAVFAALNSLPPAKRILVAVEARKDPPTFSRAFFPKIMPLGLIRKTFAVPFAPRVPSRKEGDLPVTRLIILVTVAGLSKRVAPPVGIENSVKLWKRLVPANVPPLTSVRFPIVSTLVGTLPSGIACAATRTARNSWMPESDKNGRALMVRGKTFVRGTSIAKVALDPPAGMVS
jgi:hypothetical protein